MKLKRGKERGKGLSAGDFSHMALALHKLCGVRRGNGLQKRLVRVWAPASHAAGLRIAAGYGERLCLAQLLQQHKL